MRFRCRLAATIFYAAGGGEARSADYNIIIAAALHGVSRSHRVATLLALPFACARRYL